AAAAVSSAVDATAAQRQVGRRPDAQAAVAAARRVIAAEPGMHGSVTVAGDGSIRVTTSTTTDTVLLSLIGITRLQGNGEAGAQLYD
ncbi:MAG: hypothetical protein QM582_06905, partial [Micropruina sp.]|uniref:hypothetical protein n=1 Tax=Micropruina sp. TaxID=2737536 RepID=UPI0039E38B8A